MAQLSRTPPRTTYATHDDIRRLFGDLDVEDVLGILTLMPTVGELEEAQSWLEGQGDVVARQGRSQTSKISAILEIVGDDQDEPSDLR
ncbi:MAG: hypothetical protein K8S25_11990 [Alphaproteobacteria bacterium]|nr:hypothetical protein [Alphaproteobacteria bacterium]